MDTPTPLSWLLFTSSLPGRAASTPRVRLWRALKELGAGTLRDGVALLPATEAHREKLRAIGDQVEAEGGSHWLLELPPQDTRTEQRLLATFDRAEIYGQFLDTVMTLHAGLTGLDEASARRSLRQLERDFEAIVHTDFFPSGLQAEARQALEALTSHAHRHFSPQEPAAASGRVQRLETSHYQGRCWATRRHLWIDRVASAWLLRRFIDTEARFVWLEQPQDCPDEALGFDFDGAAFTHIGTQVTFEVLLASFGLEDDPGLTQLGRLVHYLDVGGVPVAEAAGLEAVLAGLRENTANDDALLAAMTPVLDALHQRFCTPTTRGQ